MNDQDHHELMMLYQITVDDLTYFKTQQWAVSTYAFLLYAGIVGVKELLGEQSDCTEKVVVSIFVVAVLIAGCAVLSKLQDSIRLRQKRLDATRVQFGKYFQAAWSAEIKGKEYIHSIWFLYAAVVFGSAVSVYIIWV